MAPLRLTNLGKIAYRHGSTVAPSWYSDMAATLNRMADADEDWEFAINERIAGLTELALGVRRHGLDWLKQIAP